MYTWPCIRGILPGMRTDIRTETSPLRRATAGRPRNLRARTTNDLLAIEGIDRRSAGGRRYQDLIDSFVEALNGDGALTEAQRVAVRRAAELTVIAEQQRARALRGEPVDPLALVRLEGMTARAVRALGIGLPSQRTPSIDEHLRALEAAND